MIYFQALNGDDTNYPIPENLSDVQFGKFLAYLEEVLPHEPEKLAILKESYLNQREANFHIARIDAMDRPKPLDRKHKEDWQKNIQEIKAGRKKMLDNITDAEYSRDFLPYFARVVSFFSGMEYDALMGIGEYKGKPPMDYKTLEALYWKIMSGLEVRESDLTFIQEFELDGEKYTLPDRLMENATVIEFMESSQFEESMKQVKDGKWKAMLDVTCVLLKKPGEQYSDEVYQRNRRNFHRLTMGQMLNVAFFLMKRSNTLGQSTLIYSLSRQIAKIKQASKSSIRLSAGT